MTFATVLAVVHGSHEDTGTTLSRGSVVGKLSLLVDAETYLGRRALPAETLNLPVTVDLVVLEHSELDLLALVLDLLGGGVDLLLALLAASTETQHQVESGLLLDVVVGEGAAVLELLSGEDQTLLVWGDSLLVCRAWC